VITLCITFLSNAHGETSLHKACFARNLTNLDFVELLLKSGADAANTQDHEGRTLLLYTTQLTPGAAKFLLSS
jgi:ankyrin repeat protein